MSTTKSENRTTTPEIDLQLTDGEHRRLVEPQESSVGNRIRRAMQTPTGIPAGAMRYLRGARIQRGRAVVGPHCEVSGAGSWDIDGKLTIGVVGMPFNADSDRTVVRNDGRFRATGHVLINRGARVVVDEGAQLSIGSDTFVNCFTIIHATSLITIGRDCAISWRCEIFDSQYHALTYEGRRGERRRVTIGDHVWIGAGTRILDGSEIGDGCVIAAGSVVSGSFPPRSLLGGTPTRIIRPDVDWTL